MILSHHIKITHGGGETIYPPMTKKEALMLIHDSIGWFAFKEIKDRLSAEMNGRGEIVFKTSGIEISVRQ